MRYKTTIHGRRTRARNRLLTAALIILAIWGACPSRAAAAPEAAAGPVPATDKLHAVSDRIVFDSAQSCAELTGHVKVTQGQTVITADQLKIFYKKDAADAGQPAGDNAIDRLEATGNVRIALDGGVASSEKAVYLARTKTLTLSGDSAKFVRGDNAITGSVITVNRESGTVTFESSDEQPVEAVIFSGDTL